MKMWLSYRIAGISGLWNDLDLNTYRVVFVNFIEELSVFHLLLALCLVSFLADNSIIVQVLIT